MSRVFVHRPDEAVCCGVLGELYPTYWARFDSSQRHPVTIYRAVVTKVYPDREVEIDYLQDILKSPYLRESIEQEIFKAYEGAMNSEWEEPA